MIGLFHDLLNFLGKGLAFFYDLVPNYGVAIILLTVATRVVLLPLTIKQTRSMQEMQKIQPELKRLQAKYKGGDRQKLNEEMMKLYKEHHVNPLGGCLPMLLQLPIFLALYRVFAGCGKAVAGNKKACLKGFVGTKYLPHFSALEHAINHGRAGFLGMDLGIAPFAALKEPGGLVHAAPFFVLIFFMVATTWYQQKQMMAVSSGQQAAQMQMMGKIMPLVLGVFSLNLPAGVSIYWVASNVWTIVQQRFVLGKPVIDASGAAAAAKSDGASGGGAKGSTAAKTLAGKNAAAGKPGVKPGAKPKAPPAAMEKAVPKDGVRDGVRDVVKEDAAGTKKPAAPQPGRPPKVGPRTPVKVPVELEDAAVQDEPAEDAQSGGSDEAGDDGIVAGSGMAATNGKVTNGGRTSGGPANGKVKEPVAGPPSGAGDTGTAETPVRRQPAASGRPAGSRGPGGQGASRGGSNARKKRRR